MLLRIRRGLNLSLFVVLELLKDVPSTLHRGEGRFLSPGRKRKA
jgi:hypothetical protein